jgi:RecA-family ATPase
MCSPFRKKSTRAFFSPSLADPGVREALAAPLREHEAPVLVLDPFASVFLGDENDTRAMNGAKEHLEGLVRINPRALLVLCHHSGKAGERGEVGSEAHAARGSSVLPAWADVQLNLKYEPEPKGSGRVNAGTEQGCARDESRWAEDGHTCADRPARR